MAEGGGLLNRYTVKSRIGGSNPPLSAILLYNLFILNYLSYTVLILWKQLAGLFRTKRRDFSFAY